MPQIYECPRCGSKEFLRTEVKEYVAILTIRPSGVATSEQRRIQKRDISDILECMDCAYSISLTQLNKQLIEGDAQDESIA